MYLHSVPRMVRMWKRRRLAPLCRSIVGRHVILNWLPSCSLPPSLNPSLPHSLALSSTSTARSGIFLSHARAHFCLAESYGISPPSPPRPRPPVRRSLHLANWDVEKWRS